MKLTPRDKKFTIIGLIVAPIIVLLYFLLPFYDRIADQKRELELLEKRQSNYLKFIDQQSELQQKLTKLTREESKTSINLLKGGTPALAAAELQKIIDSITEKSGVKIKSVKVIDSKEQEVFTSIPVQYRFSADLTRMSAFIRGIETNRKILTITELKIRVNPTKPRELTVTLKVSGYMKRADKES